MLLQDYDYVIEHRAGVEHVNAHALSRYPEPATVDDEEDDENDEEGWRFMHVHVLPSETAVYEPDDPALLMPVAVARQQPMPADLGPYVRTFAEGQRLDPALAPLIAYLQSLQVPPQMSASEQQRLLRDAEHHYLRSDGLLVRRCVTPSAGVRGQCMLHQLVVPASHKIDIMRAHHDSSLSGHLSARRLLIASCCDTLGLACMRT